VVAGKGPQGGRRGGFSQAGRPRDENGRPISSGERRGSRTYRPGLHDWSPAGGQREAARPAQQQQAVPPPQPGAEERSGNVRDVPGAPRGDVYRPGSPMGNGTGPRPVKAGPFRSRQDPHGATGDGQTARPPMSRYGLPQQQPAGRIRRDGPAPYFRASDRNGAHSFPRRTGGDAMLTNGGPQATRPYADLDEPDAGDQSAAQAPQPQQPRPPSGFRPQGAVRGLRPQSGPPGFARNGSQQENRFGPPRRTGGSPPTRGGRPPRRTP
jgi:hypothetical protein